MAAGNRCAVLSHDKYIQSKHSHILSVKCSSSTYKKKIIYMFRGTEGAPCLHDRSRLHTEVAAETEEGCIPHIIQQCCFHWECWCLNRAMMTLTEVWHMMCTSSKHTGWSFCCFWMFYSGHTQHTKVQQGRFMQLKPFLWNVTPSLIGNQHTQLCDAHIWEARLFHVFLCPLWIPSPTLSYKSIVILWTRYLCVRSRSPL